MKMRMKKMIENGEAEILLLQKSSSKSRIVLLIFLLEMRETVNLLQSVIEPINIIDKNDIFCLSYFVMQIGLIPYQYPNVVYLMFVSFFAKFPESCSCSFIIMVRLKLKNIYYIIIYYNIILTSYIFLIFNIILPGIGFKRVFCYSAC